MTSTALSARTLPQALIRMYTLFDWPEYGQRAVIGLEGLMVTHSWPADEDYPAWTVWLNRVELAAEWAARQRVWVRGAAPGEDLATGRVVYSVLVRLVVEEEQGS